MCDDYLYKYRLEITGRMPNAAVDSSFVYLSNIEEIALIRRTGLRESAAIRMTIFLRKKRSW